MYGRIVKSERILTKLRVLDYEYICDRIAKFHKKILFITRVINIQILTTKYFSFQYSVIYCSQAPRRPEVTLCWRNELNKWRNHVINKHGIFRRRSYSNFKPHRQPCMQIRGKLQERVYRSQIRDVDQLKSRMVEEWEHFHQVVIDEAVRQWGPRLRACVRAHGGHFDHRL